MRAARAIVALTALAWTLAPTGTVAAQEPGVTADPDSPAGKEYAIPLDFHRAAGVGRDAVEGVAQPLFGVGITPVAAGARGSGGDRGSGGSSGSGGSDGSVGSGSTSGRSGRAPAGGNGRSRAGSADRAPRAAAVVQLTRPRSTTSEVGLVGLSVVLTGLLAGALFALVARRRR
jgi:hypothetical protein